MSNYYVKRDAKVKIAHELMNRGWKVYGYKEDESDSMTDYYSPANWNGVATKNGFIFVCDCYYSEGGETIRKYNPNYKSMTEADKKKIEALESKTVDRGATQAEEKTAKLMIEKIKAKIYEGNENQEQYITVDIVPKHMKSCKGMIWHVERDNAIVCKGNSITRIADAPNIWEFDIDTMKFKDTCRWNRTELNEDELKGVKALKKLIDTLEDVINVNILGNADTKIDESKPSMEKKIIIKKKSITELQGINRKEIQINDVINYNGYVKILEIYDTYYLAVKLGSQTRGYKESQVASGRMRLSKKSFDKSIEKGYTKIYKLVEKVIEEKIEKWVKVKPSKKNTNTASKNTEESAQTKENNIEEVQNNDLRCEVKFNAEKNGIELYFNDKPSDEIRNQLKANKFRWSKYNKCWYCKDSEEQRQFLKDIGLLNTDDKNIDTEKIVNRDYPEINIDDIDTYTIDKSLSDAENNVSMFRSNIDHQQEIQNRLQNANNIVIELLQHNNDKYIEYKVKSFLQWYKKKSYELYVKILRHKANNPSWAVTGRGNLNVSRYNKKMEQYNNLLNSYCQLDEKFNNYIDKIKRKLNVA